MRLQWKSDVMGTSITAGLEKLCSGESLDLSLDEDQAAETGAEKTQVVVAGDQG